MRLSILDRIVAVVAGSALAISASMLLMNVVNRYAIQGWLREWAQDGTLTGLYVFLSRHISPLGSMADEVPGLLLVWIAYLGAYLALRDGGHIAFEMVVEKLPAKLAKLVSALNSVLVLSFLAMLFYQSVRMIMIDGATEIETAELGQGWFMSAIPIFAGLMIIGVVSPWFCKKGEH
jgi:TRAP-type transport system small permease protein